MHPAFYWWWKNAHRASRCESEAHPGYGCGPDRFGGGGPRGPRGHHGHHGHHGPPGGGPDEGFGEAVENLRSFFGPFGVRRPLRFLAHKLDLSDEQVAELARIIDELKTERAQAEVDQRRTIAAFADAVEGATFGDDRAREGGELRVKSAEHLRDAVVNALRRIHAVLDEEQRKRFSYLIRTGVVSL